MVVKIFLSSNVSETPTPFQDPQLHLIESDQKQVTKVPNVLSTQANILQPEPPPTLATSISQPPTIPQTPTSVQQITTLEIIHQTTINTRTHQVYAYCQLITDEVFTD